MPSTVVARIEYNEEKEKLIVIFQSGKVYQYKNVPAEIYRAFKQARSKGRYLNKYIKGNFEYQDVE